VIIDLDRQRSPEQQELVEKYYKGYIPHVVVLDSSGKAVYNAAGEVDQSTIAGILDMLLKPSRVSSHP
jgi:thioredoxin-related protein